MGRLLITPGPSTWFRCECYSAHGPRAAHSCWRAGRCPLQSALLLGALSLARLMFSSPLFPVTTNGHHVYTQSQAPTDDHERLGRPRTTASGDTSPPQRTNYQHATTGDCGPEEPPPRNLARHSAEHHSSALCTAAREYTTQPPDQLASSDRSTQQPSRPSHPHFPPPAPASAGQRPCWP